MAIDWSVSFDSHAALIAATALVAVTATILLLRRRLKHWPTWLLLLGGALLTIAAGLPNIHRSAAQSVIVRVDLSPSTRTAEFRNRDYLKHRIARLLADTPYHIEYFANGIATVPPDSPSLPDVPCEQTIYPPTDSVVLLFSDCQFDLPLNTPPTYIALDAALEEPADGAVTGIDPSIHASVTTRVAGESRIVSISGASPSPIPALFGPIVHPITVVSGTTSIVARLNSIDPWPENDILTSTVMTDRLQEKWWIGARTPLTGWKQISADSLPSAAENYLVPSTIVLSNVSASEFDITRQRRLTQYVRDLGGSLLILGGDHAFGAGGYYGSLIDALSPLASNPPEPTQQWIILVDASGSMSSAAAGSTRWALATQAATRLLPSIPGNDLVSIGSFSDSIDWWTQNQPAKTMARMSLPPARTAPHGPTNLQPAIENSIALLPGTIPSHLLVVSDLDATITKPDDLTTRLKSRQVRLDLLAIGQGSALDAVKRISLATGGAARVSEDPLRWALEAHQLLTAALPDRLEKTSGQVIFDSNAINIATLSINQWNHVWLKQSATQLATIQSGSRSTPAAAEWNVGTGRVVATSFTTPASLVDQLAAKVAANPRDPRVSVSHEAGRELVVAVHGADGTGYLNDLKFDLELRDAEDTGIAPRVYPIPQIAPGEYRRSLPAPRASQIANVVLDGGSVDRFAVAGRYAPEFEAIGNNRHAMEELARRTGGQVILPSQNSPIDVRWPAQRVSVTSPLAFLGALLIGIALWGMRRSGAI